MTLVPGFRLGPYDITAPLGEGGMGVVYRATDSKLKREVAIKVLPEAFAADADRLARFEREAQVPAQLQHPNIASIYGLEESSGVRALVMELVEGEDLAERLKRGPLPLDEALAVARQIAEALEAAHEKGIVHRDLKPANVKLTPEGKVKVLDFGLAKAMDPAGASAVEVQNSPTLTAHATQAGVLLGTAAYMAPEQARGRPVDRRADIWAFGVVLFEMLTGGRLFAGETVSDVLAAVLTREVDFGLLPPSTPPAVANVLRRCLTRDPRERLSWIGEVRHLLRDAPPREEPAVATPPRPRRLLLVAFPWAVAAALAAVLLFSIRSRPVADVVAAELLPPAGTAFDLRVRGPGPVALSPDGSRLAFAAQARDAATLLYVRTIADGKVTVLAGSEGAQFPFWSPDGRWVAFFSRVDGKLKKAPVEGGSALTICRALNGKGGSWGRNDVIVLAPSSGSALWTVSASGGEPTPLTRLGERHNSHRHSRFLPDGRSFLYLARSPRGGESELLIGSVDGAPPRLVMKSETQAEYASGHLLFTRESVLMAQPFDPGKGEVKGPARPVVDRVLVLRGASFSAFSSSTTGLLVFHSGEPQAPVPIELRDRKGLPLRSLGEPGNYRAPTFSPDGRWIATSGAPGASVENIDLWLLDTKGGAGLRFTLEPAEDVEGIWSPDGKTRFRRDRPAGGSRHAVPRAGPLLARFDRRGALPGVARGRPGDRLRRSRRQVPRRTGPPGGRHIPGRAGDRALPVDAAHPRLPGLGDVARRPALCGRPVWRPRGEKRAAADRELAGAEGSPMSVVPGSCIGACEVPTKPGEGGMGLGGWRMRRKLTAGLVSMLVSLLAACGKPPSSNEPQPPAEAGRPAAAQAGVAAPGGAKAPPQAGPASKPGGGLLAEPSGVEGVLAISIRWSAKIVTGVPAEGLTTTVYKRTAQLTCPITSGDEAAASYFAVFDNPKADPMAATGSYQPWWNEDCTGSLTIDDTTHADDPTLAGPEPVVRTTGTRPLRTPDTPLTVETDLNRARTRYMFIAPSTDGFQQEAAPGHEAKLVKASGAPMATLDFTLEGPIGGGKREIAVQGGTLQVEWTFSRGRTTP